MKKNEEIFVCPKTGRIIVKKKKNKAFKLIMPIVGFFALLWFFIRVIPNPKRITYPCQKIAMPLALNFLAGIAGSSGVVAIITFFRKQNYRLKYILAASIIILTSVAGCHFNRMDSSIINSSVVSFIGENSDSGSDSGNSSIDAKSSATSYQSNESVAENSNIEIFPTIGSNLSRDDSILSNNNSTVSIFGSSSTVSTNSSVTSSISMPPIVNPIIENASNIYSGRVVWAHDANATNWNGKSGYWWEDKNNNQDVVSSMVREAVVSLTNQTDDRMAWDELFRNFNKNRGINNKGYGKGEKIAIKVNMNGVSNNSDRNNGCFTSPHVIYAVLMQLVERAGVTPSDITVFDASRQIPDSIFNKCRTGVLKGVKFAGFADQDSPDNDRIACVKDWSSEINWSQNMNGNKAYLPTCVTQAKYLINLSSIKGHDLAGVSLCAKNHFGTIMVDFSESPSKNPPQAANLHGYVAARDYNMGIGWTWAKRPMNSYSPLVDIMSHKDLGGKTLLYMLDGLYSVRAQNDIVSNYSRWYSVPFYNNGPDWPSSIFASQDGVAIDSVGYDFLVSENEGSQLYIKLKTDTLPAGNTADNYLIEAGNIVNPPSQTIYDPNGYEGKVRKIGEYDHWNNGTQKQYSRNLGKNYGIELISK